MQQTGSVLSCIDTGATRIPPYPVSREEDVIDYAESHLNANHDSEHCISVFGELAEKTRHLSRSTRDAERFIPSYGQAVIRYILGKGGVGIYKRQMGTLQRLEVIVEDDK